MPAPRQPAGAGAARGRGARKDKGTRGGRPEPQAVAPQARRPAAPSQRPSQAQRARERRLAAAAAVPRAEPGIKIPPLWFQLTTWALALAGLGASTYMTITHYDSSVPLACSDKGVINCALVTSSAESMVFGVLPVAVLGLAFYVFMTAAVSPWAWRLKFPALAWVRLASVVIGIGFVLYLVYTELFTLDAICLWCTSVHVLTFLLFALVVGGTAAGYGFREHDYDD